jgi:hypothetical protein
MTPQHPTLTAYFDGFNRGDFAQIAALFTPEGSLKPPLEAVVTGPAAIRTYLEQEAQGMAAHPQSHTIPPEDPSHILTEGHVTLGPMQVRVRWLFQLDRGDRIHHLRVKIMTPLQNLMHHPKAAQVTP